jgi:hypothetical protein
MTCTTLEIQLKIAFVRGGIKATILMVLFALR